MNAKRRLLLLCVPAALLAACESTPKRQAAAEPLPPQVVRRLETVRGERMAYPRFRDIPPAPTDVRTPEQWAQLVRAVQAEGSELTQWAAQNPVWITDTARLVEAARRAVADAGPPPPPDSRAQTEAFVQRMRELAIAPPPPPQ